MIGNPDPTDAVREALQEDIGSGDLSSTFFIPESGTSSAAIVAREEGVLAGLDAALCAFELMIPPVLTTPLMTNGAQVHPGSAVLRIEGPTRSILTAERTALNFLQQLSGVATLTAKFVQAIVGTGAKILDTRKTIPGLRALQKAAVLSGGGTNHRFGLHDMVMIKDNHLTACGGFDMLREKIAIFRSTHPGIRVEVEADTLEQVREIFQISGVDVILLDNMDLETIGQCVLERPPGILLEASGGIHLGNAREIACTGVDFLSIGALTHSAKALDFGLDFF